MLDEKTLFKPTIESNPFYKVAFDADFSQLSNEKMAKSVFYEKLTDLVALIRDILGSVQSVTQAA